MYTFIRNTVPFVSRDIALGDSIDALSEELKEFALYFERKISPL
ncbi:MAG: hypothetical protein ABL958_16105 [Bdellovibrionia bacterium]